MERWGQVRAGKGRRRSTGGTAGTIDFPVEFLSLHWGDGSVAPAYLFLRTPYRTTSPTSYRSDDLLRT